MYENLNLSTLTPQEYSQWLKNEIKEGRRDACELKDIHVLQTKYDVKRTDAIKPEVVAHSRVQIYNPKDWETYQEDYLRRAGYEIKVLWPYTEPKAEVKGPEVPQEPDPEPAEEETKKATKGRKKAEDKINLG